MASTWGTNTWGANEWQDDEIVVSLSSPGATTALGTAGGGNQARQPYLEKYDFKICDNLDNANHVHDYGLYIGNHPELNAKQIKSVVNKLNEL